MPPPRQTTDDDSIPFSQEVLPEDVEDQYSYIHCGNHVDILDVQDVWSEAIILSRQSFEITYKFLYIIDTKEHTMDYRCGRIAPHHSHTFDGDENFEENQRIEVFDNHPSQRKWYEAFVRQHIKDNHRIYIHYLHWSEEWNEWIEYPSKRIAQYGRHIKHSMSSHYVVSEPQSHVRQIQGNDELTTYYTALGRLGYSVITQKGDGNCLFRSISHQIYGTPDNHLIVRHKCLEYMVQRKAWYSLFIAQDFDEYIREKAKDGTWGDDPEIQACCELYTRPAEIWAYNQEVGAKQLKTFHSPTTAAAATTTTVQYPIRLSYYGGGHYNSIACNGFERYFITSTPGQYEDHVLSVTASSPETVEIPDAPEIDHQSVDALLQENIEFSKKILEDSLSYDNEPPPPTISFHSQSSATPNEILNNQAIAESLRDNPSLFNQDQSYEQQQPPPFTVLPIQLEQQEEKQQQENKYDDLQSTQDEIISKVMNDSLAETNNNDIENQLLSKAMEESMTDINRINNISSEMWICSSCTYRNSGLSEYCEMCGEPSDETKAIQLSLMK